MKQISRFTIIGILNTLIDFVVTAAVFYSLGSSSSLQLTAASIVGCLCAMTSSYIFHKNYTFANSGASPYKFIAVAIGGMVINTSVTSYSFHLSTQLVFDPVLQTAILAKLLGVLTAFGFSFFGYKFYSFSASFSRIEVFKGNCEAGRDLIWILGASLLVRAIYLSFDIPLTGDAVRYSDTAIYLASQGSVQPNFDIFWNSLFCYWQSLFLVFGFPEIACAKLSSLVPAIVMLVPVYKVFRSFSDEKVSGVATLLIATHPRLVEYSLNGYTESFAFALISFSIYALVCYTGARSKLLGGFSLGLYFCVRPEGLAALVLVSLVLVFMMPTLRRGIVAAGLLITGFLLATVLYIALDLNTTGSCSLWNKSSNLSKSFNEQTSPVQAALQTYSAKKKSTANKASFQELAESRVKQVIHNWKYTLERLPGVIINPLFIFSAGILFWGSFSLMRQPAPLILSIWLLFPFLVYPQIHVEPRLLMIILIPMSIFCTLSIQHLKQLKPGYRILLNSIVVLSLLFQVLVSIYRAYDLEQKNKSHYQIAQWLSQNSKMDSKIAGCGYGHISTTTKIISRNGNNRVVTNTTEELGSLSKKDQIDYLILYDKFLERFNPQLTQKIELEIPFYQLAHIYSDKYSRKIRIYKINNTD